MAVKFYKKEHQVPLEMHKVRIVQKLFLPPVEKRVEYINEAGNNTFLLQNKDVFMDMLTDSGVNAMSDLQQAAMLRADDSYAGSETCNRLEACTRGCVRNKIFPSGAPRTCVREHSCRSIRQTGIYNTDELSLHNNEGAYNPSWR